MGSRLGILKIAAKKAGLPLDEYQRRIADGLKRCTFCEEWKAADKFAADATRWDGKTAGCFACRNDRASGFRFVRVDKDRPYV
jgi:hypothetical protein